jgi:hypothetical protein
VEVSYCTATCVSHEVWTLPRVTLARMDFPSSPLVSTVIVLVLWPLMIFPTLKRHRKLIRGSPARSATNVKGLPALTEEGQRTLITGTWERNYLEQTLLACRSTQDTWICL